MLAFFFFFSVQLLLLSLLFSNFTVQLLGVRVFNSHSDFSNFLVVHGSKWLLYHKMDVSN